MLCDRNKDIFETIYYGACEASVELASRYGPYDSYHGSPASKGLLQYDLWGVRPSPRWDWITLKENISKFGMRNSLLLAPMPTATTAQVLGNSEGVDPFISNVFIRRVGAGEFIVSNRHLVETLSRIGLWTDSIRRKIVAAGGSVQNIQEIPQHIRSVFKTAWEIPQRSILDMAADRGAFICQSQSMNIYMANPTIAKLTSMHFYAWEIGLKTGMYYLRTRPRVDPIKLNIDDWGGGMNEVVTGVGADVDGQLCAIGEGGEGCISCGS